MLGLTDPQKGTLRLSRLLTLDIAAVVVLTGLVVGKLLPLRGTVVVGYVALFAVNVLVAQRATRHGARQVGKAGRAPKALWFGALVFSAAAAAAVVAWVRKPDLPSTFQAAFAVLLVCYVWYLLYRLTK